MDFATSSKEKALLEHHPNFSRLVEALYSQHIVPGIGASRATWQICSATRAAFEKTRHEWSKCRLLYELLIVDGLVLDPARRDALIPLPLHDMAVLVHEPDAPQTLKEHFCLSQAEQDAVFRLADAKLVSFSESLLQLVQVSGLASPSSSTSVLQRLALMMSAIEESKNDMRCRIQAASMDYVERASLLVKDCLTQVESDLLQLEPLQIAAEQKKRETYHQYIGILLESLNLKLSVLYREHDSAIYDQETRLKVDQLRASIESDLTLLHDTEAKVSRMLRDFYELGPDFVSVAGEYQRIQGDIEAMQQELFNLDRGHDAK